jgi:nucleoside-diphosphate-sugar epimerase
MDKTEKIVVIGAAGQIGSELVMALRKIHGSDNVYATDLRQPSEEVMESGPFQILDVMDDKRLIHFVIRHKITQIYHLAAVLSGNAEKLPVQAWKINMESLMNILDLAREVTDIKKVFWPSSIAVFGPTTPRIDTPQLTVMEPNTVYGISKLAGERWCEYYFNRYGVDVRSVRYPGLISYKTEAGGGTTDYAVEIFYEAVKNGNYECFLQENTALPMMFMNDAIQATINLMESPAEKLSIRSAYNVGGISFTPKQLSEEIKKHIPNFEVSYKPDFRQKIADSWPASINDNLSAKEWGCKAEFDINKMTRAMLEGVKRKFGK